MAKLKSLLKIEGTLDGMTFYKGKDGYLVRTKGGISKSRIQNDPAFIRTRENGTEFGHSATSGKQLRHALTGLLVDVKDGRMTSRLTQTMSRVKNQDLISTRGNRNVTVGLTTDLGKEALKAFDFNNNAQLNAVLLADFDFDTTTGEFSITDLIPNQHISGPGGATHLSFLSAVLNLDFETNTKEIALGNTVNVPINGTTVNVNSIPTALPTAAGAVFFLVKISFFQEVNNIQYPLNNGAYNVLKIIAIE
ncbi:hypothetical protein ES677_12090 [Bizionia gelidisalsuginis]|uniref:Uncharacterized protein n=2 Tax=Bizionia TaxID=283785 RepID=A0A8H2LAQ6_9FLAO|nr:MULTISPECIES: hypothetical protein [Bizionia]TYB70652.1 hypothetical protein ES676_12805 [Bizionia saleffrena]TYC10220.1 hypothetical protein ES677_12090 [Bizionia gelidisalsuginis]